MPDTDDGADMDMDMDMVEEPTSARDRISALLHRAIEDITRKETSAGVENVILNKFILIAEFSDIEGDRWINLVTGSGPMGQLPITSWDARGMLHEILGNLTEPKERYDD